MRTHPARWVADKDDEHVVVGDGFSTTDPVLARCVAEELDRVVPLACSPDCPQFLRLIDCCGRAGGLI